MGLTGVFTGPNAWLNIKREHWRKRVDEEKQTAGLCRAFHLHCVCVCVFKILHTHTDDILSVHSECIKTLVLKCI